MKALNKKLKKADKVPRFFFKLTLLLYLGCLIYFIYGILHLSRIETIIRIIVIAFFVLWFVLYILAGLITVVGSKKKTFIFLTIITLLFCPLFITSSYLVNTFYDKLKIMNRDKITYTTNVIALKDTKFGNNSTIGMIADKDDIEGNILAKKLIKKKKLDNKIVKYDEYPEMLKDLYNGVIDGCFISSNYAITFSNNDDFSDIADKVKVVYEYSEEMKNADSTVLNNTGKDLTEPFSLLIMGVDSEIDGLKANQAFNGDTLILVTFNPNTLTATMFSIPRDTYVPIACNNNKKNKINSSAAYGSTCVIRTIQNLTGINIDYYVKVNFKGVVDLVDAVGGVTVDVETPTWWYTEGNTVYKNKVCEQDSKRRFGNNIVCIDLGVQNLNGEQALAYARCRHLYALSDIARNQHQQQVIEALLQKVKVVRSIKDFEKILDAVSRNIETNITTPQMMSLYNVAKKMIIDDSSTNKFSIQKTYLAYYDLGLSYTSALGYYEESLNEIVKAMKVNLGIIPADVIKTFEISYSENYTTPLIGYGLTGAKEQVVPNFVGYDSYYVDNWCNNNNITCNFSRVESITEKNQIISQSVSGVLLDSVSVINFTVSDGIYSNPDVEEETNKEESKKEEVKKEEPKKEEQKKEEPKQEETKKEEPKKEEVVENEPEENNEKEKESEEKEPTPSSSENNNESTE